MNPYEIMVDSLERYHGAARSEAGRRLAMELMCEGSSVTSDFVRLGVGAPWVFSPQMEQFYSASDGFVYELISWHHRARRVLWRREIARKVTQLCPDGGRVLALGDGVGFDSLEVCTSCPGVEVTSFEFEGASSRFAQRRAEAASPDVRRRLTFVHQLEVIPQGVFDVIICLDVLEHVVSPLSVISDMVAYLKPQGQAIISESFGEIVPLKPTHLRTNLRHAGRTLSLFRRSGFAYEETFCGRLYRFSRAGSGWEPLKRLQEMRDGARLEAIGAIAKVQFWRHFGTKEIDVERALREAVGDLADDLLVAKS